MVANRKTPGTPIFHECIKAKRLLDTHREVIVYDTETTGLGPVSSRIIEFSAARYVWNGKTYELVDSIEQYIKPPFPIDPKITELTGITNEQLVDKPDEEEAFQRIYEFMNRPSIFVGYNNINFDDQMISKMAGRCRNKTFSPYLEIDVVRLVRELVRRNNMDDNAYKLCNAAKYYKCTVEGFHNASIDIVNTWLVLQSAMVDFQLQLQDMEGQQFAPETAKLRLWGMNRWKKSLGKTIIDRIYVRTNCGQYIVDLVKNVLSPKDIGPNIDPEVLLNHMDWLAWRHGLRGYMDLDGELNAWD